MLFVVSSTQFQEKNVWRVFILLKSWLSTSIVGLYLLSTHRAFSFKAGLKVFIYVLKKKKKRYFFALFIHEFMLELSDAGIEKSVCICMPYA